MDSVHELVLDDYIFRETMKVANDTNKYDSCRNIYRWTMRCYQTHVALGIRRIIDTDKRTYSLLILLREIEQNPNVITRRSFLSKYSSNTKCLGETEFDRIAGPGQSALSSRAVTNDLLKIEAIARDLRPIVDKVIAHRERKYRILRRVTWNTIHKSISDIEDICKCYSLILNQVTMISMLPSISASDASNEVKSIWGLSTS